MYAVGRLGSYISQGVYTVSGPFHPFGGAVDIIVVEQQDGSFKSSPWYVRFGKFQGVLKTKEKAVSINVNGVEADFHMNLDHKGEAYFLREVDGDEGDSVFYPSSSGEETDGQSRDRRPMKFKSCNYDADQSNLVTKIDVSHGKILTRTSSRRSRILGLVFGRKSRKENSSREEEDGPGVVRADSLERAEIAADLLEVNWSTNLASSRRRKDNLPQFSAPDISGSEADKDLAISTGRTETDSPLNDNTINSLDHPVLHEEFGIHDNGMSTSSMFGFQKLGSSDKEFGVEVSCLNTEHIIGTSNLGESGLQENFDLNCETMTEIDKLRVTNANHENAKIFIWQTHSPEPDSAELDACPSKKLNKELDFKEKDILLPGHGVSEEESGADRVEAFIYSETLESSRVGQDTSGGKTDETSYVSCEGGAEVRVHTKTLHETAELISEVNSLQETTSIVEKEPLDIPELLADPNCGNFFNDAQILGSEGTSSNSFANSCVTEAYTQMVAVDPINSSVKELESCGICTIYGSNHSIYEVHDGENMRDEDTMSKLQHSLKPIGDSQEFKGDIAASVEAITVSPSEGSDEEELLFGDLDDYNHEEVKCMESMLSNHVERESHPPVTPKGSEAVTQSPSPNDESYSSSDKFAQESMPKDVEDFRQKSRIVSSRINIRRSNKIVGEDIGRMAESLPNMWSPIDGLVVDDLHHSLGYSLDLNSESSKWIPLREDVSSFIKSDADKEDLVFQAQPMAHISEELKNVPADLAVGELSKAIDASTESWRAWPFPFKRSRSMKTTQPARTRGSDAESTLETTSGMDGEKDVLKPKVKKKNVRAITPTPEELASLNLKEGNNTVTFTFSTSMLGPQQVDARIFLWKWDTRVVISDVDGTITKSDVLGQFMPLVGMDWSQTGVAHLFSAIKENGYQLLFLSARAISQAYHTRQFLLNLKQNGKALPDGPVVISPDGLFPSLFREVIRRAPHEFKIACLEDIKALFPSDRNPFYAGFGNRDTDEFSYLKVGIPKGKIFIINPKGEVAVHRRVDTKSYTSLHALVHDMFPPMSSSEQEDFNSWNFWKLPPPAINF